MCFKRNVDSVLQQIKECHDPGEIRQLLEQLDACKTCPEAEASYVQNKFECSYRIQLKTALNNLVEYVLIRKSE
jgi:hypothetical protein